MRLFDNMPFSQFKVVSSLLTLSLSLTACNLPQPESRLEQTDNKASFIVTKTTGQEISQTLKTSSQLADSKQYIFRSCITDLKNNKLIGQKFAISNEDGSIQYVSSNDEAIAITDDEGCLSWKESIQFPIEQQAKVISLKRKVIAKGLHKGARSIEIGINPWSDKESIVDLSFGKKIKTVSEKEVLEEKSQTKTQKSHNLTMRSLNYKVRELKRERGVARLSYDISFIPQIILKDLNGYDQVKDLNAGKFKLVAYLLSSQKTDGLYPVLAAAESEAVALTKTGVLTSLFFNVECIPTSKDLLLGLQIIPVDNPNLDNFEGLFTIGASDNLKSGTRLDLNPETVQDNFTISSILGKKMDSKSCNTSGFLPPKISISQLEFKLMNVGNDKTSTRSVEYTIKACFKDAIDQKLVRSQEVEITKFRTSLQNQAQKIKLTVDDSSCIAWTENISHNFYECAKFYSGLVSFKIAALGLSEDIEVAINPWEKWLIGRDLRFVDPQEPIRYTCENNLKTSEIVLNNYYINTMNKPDTNSSFDYSIDNYLNLTMTRYYSFRTEPHVTFYSDLEKGREDVPRLRDGVYLLRLAVVEPLSGNYDKKLYPEGLRLIDGFERIVPVVQGTIRANIAFSSDNLKDFGNRNELLAEVLPVDETRIQVAPSGNMIPKSIFKTYSDVVNTKSGLISSTFRGSIVMDLDNNSTAFFPISEKSTSEFFIHSKNSENSTLIIPKILDQKQRLVAYKQARLAKLSSVENFARLNNLQIQDVNMQNAKGVLMAKALSIPAARNYQEDQLYQLNASYYQNKVKEVSAESALTFIDQLVSRPKIDEPLARKLCLYWFQYHLPSLKSEKGGILNESEAIQSAIASCIEKAKVNPQAAFSVQRVLITKQLGHMKFLGGYSGGLSVGGNYSLSNSYSESFNVSGSISASLGLTKRFQDVVSIGVNGNYSISRSENESASFSNSVSVSENTNINIQQNMLRFALYKYQECATIQMNPALFLEKKAAKMNLGLWKSDNTVLDSLNPKLSLSEKMDAITKGIIICKNKLTENPVWKMERYFTLFQPTNGNQTQDATTNNNRRFFIPVRGISEYRKVQARLRGELEMPADREAQSFDSQDMQTRIDKVFKNFTNLPGIFIDHYDQVPLQDQ